MAKRIEISANARAQALRRALHNPVGVKMGLTAGQKKALDDADAREAGFCCGAMSDAVKYRCPDHEHRSDCADCLIEHYPSSGDYGILIHDGGTSYMRISFCPWCGTRL